MVTFVKLFLISISFLAVSSDPYKKDDKTISQIALKIRPSKETVESNIISESQVKYYNSQEYQNNTQIILQNEQDKLLNNIWQLLRKAGNNLSTKPSNPQLINMLINVLIPNHPFVTGTNKDKRPDVVSITEGMPASTGTIAPTIRTISTTTEAIVTTTIPISTTKEAMATTTRPISINTESIDSTTKAITTTEEYTDDDDDNARPIKFVDTKAFDFEKLARKMPKVEHGSIQYMKTSAS